MATVTEIFQQSKQIAILCSELESIVGHKSTLNHFAENPELVDGIVTATQEAKSREIILYGLKESIEYKLRPKKFVSLPSKSDLVGYRSNNWLSPGDVILGWVGYSADRPRVIDELSLTGYYWRFIDDDASIQRKPVTLDKFFQDIGWVKAPNDNLDDIYEMQAAEMTGLEEQINYFAAKQWLDA